jgi:hypothetical protein
VNNWTSIPSPGSTDVLSLALSAVLAKSNAGDTTFVSATPVPSDPNCGSSSLFNLLNSVGGVSPPRWPVGGVVGGAGGVAVGLSGGAASSVVGGVSGEVAGGMVGGVAACHHTHQCCLHGVPVRRFLQVKFLACTGTD